MPVTSGHELSCFGAGFAFCCNLNPVAAVVHSGLLIGLKCCANLYQQERTGSAAYLVWKERVANCRLGKALPKECTL